MNEANDPFYDNTISQDKASPHYGHRVYIMGDGSWVCLTCEALRDCE